MSNRPWLCRVPTHKRNRHDFITRWTHTSSYVKPVLHSVVILFLYRPARTYDLGYCGTVPCLEIFAVPPSTVRAQHTGRFRASTWLVYPRAVTPCATCPPAAWEVSVWLPKIYLGPGYHRALRYMKYRSTVFIFVEIPPKEVEYFNLENLRRKKQVYPKEISAGPRYEACTADHHFGNTVPRAKIN